MIRYYDLVDYNCWLKYQNKKQNKRYENGKIINLFACKVENNKIVFSIWLSSHFASFCIPCFIFAHIIYIRKTEDKWANFGERIDSNWDNSKKNNDHRRWFEWRKKMRRLSKVHSRDWIQDWISWTNPQCCSVRMHFIQ